MLKSYCTAVLAMLTLGAQAPPVTPKTTPPKSQNAPGPAGGAKVQPQTSDSGAPVSGAKPDTKVQTDSGALIDIDIKDARLSTLGSAGQGVYATIRNTAKEPLHLPRDKAVFVLFPAVPDGAEIGRGCADFPTIRGKDATLTLLPGETYTILWNLHPNSCNFPPDQNDSLFTENWAHSGLYKVVFNGQFTTGENTTLVHSVTKTIDTRFAISIYSLVFWSFLGGVMAFWVEGFVATDTAPLLTKLAGLVTWQQIFSLLGNGLLSSVLVILGTQLADTAFPIKVDAGSLIGAFTSGFLLHFAANKVLQSIGAKQ